MKAKTIKGTSVEEISAELDKIITNEFTPTLAFVFVSVIDEWQAALDLMDKKGIAVFGAITPISFDDSSIIDKGIVVMLLDINPEYFKIVLADNKSRSLTDSISHIGKTGKTAFGRPAFLISVSDLRNSGEEIMSTFEEEVGMDITIMGGYSGDLETWKGDVFTNNSSSDDGIVALIFDQDKVDVKGIAVSGWKAVGTEKTVTKSDGNWILTIDDQPAIEVVSKFVGDQSIKTGTESIVKLDTTTYVLQADRGGDSPAYIATLEYNTENGGVMCSTQVSEGTKFRFSLPPDFEVVDKVIGTSTELKEKELPEADALIIFSCVGRNITLGPMAADEINGLAKTWGKPTAGFFSLGEFGRVKNGRPEYHGTTCSWVALREK